MSGWPSPRRDPPAIAEAAARPLLSVRNLAIWNRLGTLAQPIVSAFDLDLAAGEVVGIVGESGSGKSMMARALIGLPPRGMEISPYDITLIGRRVTVVANGKAIIVDQIIPGITGGALDSKEGEPGPIMLQGDHGPVEYRNIIITPAK